MNRPCSHLSARSLRKYRACRSCTHPPIPSRLAPLTVSHYSCAIHNTGRKKADKSLFTMQQSETPPSDRFRIEVETALRAHELVSAIDWMGKGGKGNLSELG